MYRIVSYSIDSWIIIALRSPMRKRRRRKIERKTSQLYKFRSNFSWSSQSTIFCLGLPFYHHFSICCLSSLVIKFSLSWSVVFHTVPLVEIRLNFQSNIPTAYTDNFLPFSFLSFPFMDSRWCWVSATVWDSKRFSFNRHGIVVEILYANDKFFRVCAWAIFPPSQSDHCISTMRRFFATDIGQQQQFNNKTTENHCNQILWSFRFVLNNAHCTHMKSLDSEKCNMLYGRKYVGAKRTPKTYYYTLAQCVRAINV